MVQIVVDSNIGEKVELADKCKAVIGQGSGDTRGRSRGEREGGWLWFVSVRRQSAGIGQSIESWG